MKKVKFFLSIIIIFMFVSCNKNEDPVKPYEQDIFEFTLMWGNNGIGMCGWIIVAEIDSGSVLTDFKGVNIPDVIMYSPMSKYRGKFEVLPEQYKCKDGGPDPFPGQDSPTIYPHFVNILSWEKK